MLNAEIILHNSLTMIILVINKALLERDYRVTLARQLDISIAMPIEGQSVSGLTVIPLRIKGGMNLFSELIGFFDLIKLILKERYSIFHFYSSKYYTLGPLLCRILRTKHRPIITINGLGRFGKKEYGLKFRLLSIFIKIGLRNSQSVIFQNKSDNELFIKHFKSAMRNCKSYLIYSGIHKPTLGLGKYLCEIRSPIKKKQVLYVGRQNRDKGVEYFYALAEQLYTHFDFKVIGELPVEKLIRERLQYLIKAGRITHIKYTPDVYVEIESSLCLVIPSYREGLPRVLMESYGCITPVVGFDVPGVAEFILPNKTGEVAKEHNVSALTEALFIIDQNGKDFYKEAIEDFFKRNFSMEEFLRKSTKVYADIEK